MAWLARVMHAGDSRVARAAAYRGSAQRDYGVLHANDLASVMGISCISAISGIHRYIRIGRISCISYISDQVCLDQLDHSDQCSDRVGISVISGAPVHQYEDNTMDHLIVAWVCDRSSIDLI